MGGSHGLEFFEAKICASKVPRQEDIHHTDPIRECLGHEGAGGPQVPGTDLKCQMGPRCETFVPHPQVFGAPRGGDRAYPPALCKSLTYQEKSQVICGPLKCFPEDPCNIGKRLWPPPGVHPSLG